MFARDIPYMQKKKSLLTKEALNLKGRFLKYKQNMRVLILFSVLFSCFPVLGLDFLLAT